MAFDRRIIKTRRAIKEAVIELIMEEAPRITITEIARRANIDRKTFYLHYESVNDIVRDFSRERLENLEHSLDKDAFPGGTFDVDTLFNLLNTIVVDDITLYRRIAKNPGYSSFWDEVASVIKAGTIQNLQREVKAPYEEIELYAEFFSSGVMSVYTRWLRDDIALTKEQLGKALGTVSYYGFQELLARS